MYTNKKNLKLFLPSNKNFKQFFESYYSKETEPLSSYDVTIIGGGHNGLVAASYLAKNGIKTCLLERRPILGGAAVTEEIFPGYQFSRCSYLLSLLRPQIYRDLELKKFGLEYYIRNPSSYTPLKKECWSSTVRSLTLGMDSELNFKQISQFSEKDAKQYVVFHEKLQKFVDCVEPLMDVSPYILNRLCDSNNSLWNKMKIISESDSVRKMLRGVFELKSCIPFYYEMMFSSAVDIMNKWFIAEPLKATILTDACIGSMQSPDSVGSSYVLIHHVMGGIEQNKGAWVYPKGGMGAVSNAIAKCALYHGAHLFTNKFVTGIIVDDHNIVTGVTTEDQKYIKSSIVLSNATPKVTFLDLLPEGILENEFKARIENINYKSPVTKLNVALKNIPNFVADPNSTFNQIMPHHRCTIHINCESISEILNAHSEGVNGLLPKKPMIELTIPSSLDPTISPAGNHVCFIFTQYTSYDLKDGRMWDEQTKSEYSNIVFNCIEEYAPGFMESIIGYEILPPTELERIFGLTGGNIFHGELSLDRLFFSRPANWYTVSPYTPIEGLFLCGSGAHPGGGVTGSPGRLAALAVLSDFKDK